VNAICTDSEWPGRNEPGQSRKLGDGPQRHGPPAGRRSECAITSVSVSVDGSIRLLNMIAFRFGGRAALAIVVSRSSTHAADTNVRYLALSPSSSLACCVKVNKVVVPCCCCELRGCSLVRGAGHTDPTWPESRRNLVVCNTPVTRLHLSRLRRPSDT
jgi:hypothetical protein